MIGSYWFTNTVNLKLRPTNQRVKVIQQKKYNRGWHFALKHEYLNITHSSSLTTQERERGRERNPPTWAPASPVLPPPTLISVTKGIYGPVFNKISLVDHSVLTINVSLTYYLFKYWVSLNPNNIWCGLKTPRVQWAQTVFCHLKIIPLPGNVMKAMKVNTNTQTDKNISITMLDIGLTNHDVRKLQDFCLIDPLTVWLSAGSKVLLAGKLWEDRQCLHVPICHNNAVLGYTGSSVSTLGRVPATTVLASPPSSLPPGPI